MIKKFRYTSDILGIYAAQSQRMFKNQGLFIQVKRYLSALISDWENNIPYFEESKQSEALTGKCNSFHTVNSRWVWGQVVQSQENFAIYTLIYIWKQFFRLLN